MVSDRDRRVLHGALERTLGAAPATTLMELLPPVGWADVARQSDLAALRADIRAEMAELRTELKTDMADLRAELKTDMADLRTELTTEMASLRVDLTDRISRLETKVGAQLPKLIVANIASMIGVVSLVLAAAKLF